MRRPKTGEENQFAKTKVRNVVIKNFKTQLNSNYQSISDSIDKSGNQIKGLGLPQNLTLEDQKL